MASGTGKILITMINLLPESEKCELLVDVVNSKEFTALVKEDPGLMADLLLGVVRNGLDVVNILAGKARLTFTDGEFHAEYYPIAG